MSALLERNTVKLKSFMAATETCFLYETVSSRIA